MARAAAELNFAMNSEGHGGSDHIHMQKKGVGRGDLEKRPHPGGVSTFTVRGTRGRVPVLP